MNVTLTFNLDDDDVEIPSTETNLAHEVPSADTSMLEQYKHILQAPMTQTQTVRDESPIDPMLLAGEESVQLPNTDVDDTITCIHSTIIPALAHGHERHWNMFSETTLTSFPFQELALVSYSFASFCLFEWYRLWNVPAPALKPHMSEPWNPCSNPVTLDEINAPILKKFPYVVSTKTNGVRVQVMMIRHPTTQLPIVLMVDRNTTFYDVGASALSNVDDEVRDSICKGTILDGELVERFDHTWAFVLFDVVAFDNKSLRHVVSLSKRLEAIWSWYGPLCETRATFLSNGQEFVWMSKSMYALNDTSAIDKVMSEIRPYATDGLVFTPLLFSIPFETSPFLFKWKPDALQSVDFRLVGHPPNETRNKWGLELKYKYKTKERNLLQGYWFIGYLFPLGQVVIKDSDALQAILDKWKDETTVQSCIVECKLEQLDLEHELMEWSIARERTDKSDPNSDLTLLGTLKTILYPLTWQGLKQISGQVDG